jgi:hypothetical protein
LERKYPRAKTRQWIAESAVRERKRLVAAMISAKSREWRKSAFPNQTDEVIIAYLIKEAPLFFQLTDAASMKSKTPHIFTGAGVAFSVCAYGQTQVDTYKKTGRATDAFLSSVIGLAKLDAIVRAGYFPTNFISDVNDVADLNQIHSLIKKSEVFKNKKELNLNPNFRESSKLVLGADADLIIDDELYDIKTFQDIYLDNDSWLQLVGYCILADLEGMGLRKAGIYFTRHDYLWTIPTSTFYQSPQYPQTKDKFIECAKTYSELFLRHQEQNGRKTI